jgi:class 3 adenylate cyclase
MDRGGDDAAMNAEERRSSGAPPARRRAGTRGFLFADLRGYTAYLGARGADEAASLLERYRRLVRTAVEAHDGAEIRTEGDSFYVVFPDASSAVACGLAIVAGAERARADDPEHPISVGVGVHAGETIETDEGYVGTAVNLAARLCAAAPAGAVLVSDTVRALTAGVAPVRYEPGGRRRFKGIGEPVATFRALDMAAPSPAATHRRRWPLVLGAAAGLSVAAITVALVGGAITREGLGGLDPGSSSSSSALAGPSASPGTGATAAEPAPTASVPGASSAAGAGSAAAEARLLALVEDRFHPRCRPTRPEEIPRYAETRNDTHGPISWPLSVQAGVICEPFGLEVPDQLGYWLLDEFLHFSGLNETDALFNIAGRREALPGPCDGTGSAYESWSAGPIAGHLVCYHDDAGVATLYWSYTGTDVLARASRDDGDMAALVSWWRNDARFRRP